MRLDFILRLVFSTVPRLSSTYAIRPCPHPCPHPVCGHKNLLGRYWGARGCKNAAAAGRRVAPPLSGHLSPSWPAATKGHPFVWPAGMLKDNAGEAGVSLWDVFVRASLALDTCTQSARPERRFVCHGQVRAVATNCKATFIALSGAQIYSPFVGDSERTLRNAFKEARTLAPSILFLDEVSAVVGDGDAGCPYFSVCDSLDSVSSSRAHLFSGGRAGRKASWRQRWRPLGSGKGECGCRHSDAPLTLVLVFAFGSDETLSTLARSSRPY